jgi:hypothetical protein
MVRKMEMGRETEMERRGDGDSWGRGRRYRE